MPRTKKITELKTRTPAPHAMRSFDMAREDMKSGRIVAFAFTAVARDGQVITFYSNEKFPALVGAAAILQQRLVEEYGE